MAQYTQQQLVSCFQDGDIDAHLARGGRHLAANQTSADDDQRLARMQGLAQGLAVGQVPQGMDACQVATGNCHPPRAGAGGQQQPVVSQRRAGFELDLAIGHIQAAHPPSQLQVQVGRFVPGGVQDRRRLWLLALQYRLGQGGAVVSVPRFVADQMDAPAVALGTQGARSRRAGQAGTDDGNGFDHGARYPALK